MTRTLSLRFSSLLVAGALAFAPRAALGDSGTPAGSAESYQRARAAMLAKKWDDAYELLLPLYKQQKTYEVALNLGQTEMRLGKYREAAEHLSQGIRVIPLNLPERADVETRSHALLREAKAKVTTITLNVDQPGAEVRINGSLAGQTPLDGELFFDPGPIAIEVTLSGFEPASRELTGTAGEQRLIQLALTPAAAAPLPPPGAPLPPPASEPPARDDGGVEPRTVVLISGLALGGVALVATSIFAVSWSSADSRAEELQSEIDASGGNACASSQPPAACAELDDEIATRDTAGTILNISIPVAAVALVGTGVAYFAWPSEKRSSATRPFLTPHVGQNTAGLTLSGSF